MQRPTTYSTRQGEAVLACLAAAPGRFVTAAEVMAGLRERQVVISRATVYRQLERLVEAGSARRRLFEGDSVQSFQYVSPDDPGQETFHMRCEVCEKVFNLDCDEVEQVSQHVLAEHAFVIDEGKTVFYGRCKNHLQK